MCMIFILKLCHWVDFMWLFLMGSIDECEIFSYFRWYKNGFCYFLYRNYISSSKNGSNKNQYQVSKIEKEMQVIKLCIM